MKFSCTIPVYNTRPSDLLEAFYSIMDQTLQPDELIIVDDGSSCEKTIATLRFIEDHFNIKVHWLEENGGTAVALNHAHRVASHDYLAIMASDDIAHPERFERQIKFLKENKGTHILGSSLFGFKTNDIGRSKIFVMSHADKISAHNLPIEKKNNWWVVNHGTVIYSRAVFENYFYDPQYRRAQDVHLWKVLLNDGFTFRNIPDVLYAYRKY